MSKRNNNRAEMNANDTAPEQVTEQVEENVSEEAQPVEAPVFTGKVVNTKKVYLRSEDSLESDPIAILDEGTEVSLIDKKPVKKFYQVLTRDAKVGYIYKDYLEIV